MPNSVELKAEWRKPSGEKRCGIEGIPSLTGVLAHFREYEIKATVGFMPNGVELKAERRKPSGERHRDTENIPSVTGVLAHFR